MGDDAPIFGERKAKVAKFLTHQLRSYQLSIALGHFE